MRDLQFPEKPPVTLHEGLEALQVALPDVPLELTIEVFEPMVHRLFAKPMRPTIVE